jgi:hypothetical protein
MNIRMGSHTFEDVIIPLLWGTRAILQDQQERLSVIDLSGDEARPEIIGDAPAPDVEYVPERAGFSVERDGRALYSYTPEEKRFVPRELRLPECQITADSIRVGSNLFQSNVIVGAGIGIVVTEQGIGMGAPLPPELAALVVPSRHGNGVSE